MNKEKLEALITKYQTNLKNAKDNRAVMCDKLSDAENDAFDREIAMYAEMCRDLKSLRPEPPKAEYTHDSLLPLAQEFMSGFLYPREIDSDRVRKLKKDLAEKYEETHKSTIIKYFNTDTEAMKKILDLIGDFSGAEDPDDEEMFESRFVDWWTRRQK